MFKHLSLLAVACIAVMGIAQQPKDKVTIPVNQTSATSGKQMYANYCASCHGADGKGQGPVAAVLNRTPTDLTLLSKNNGGKFPDTHIAATLQFGVETTAHGNAQMPVWGPILGKMNRANSQERQLRISNLCRYLESIQAK